MPETTRAGLAHTILGWVGALLLGGGVWGRWKSEPVHDFAVYLIVAGALAAAVALWLTQVGSPIRVGDGGVAVERGSEITRLLWCDIERIYVQATRLVVESKDRTLSIPFGIHSRAVAWVLSEASRRVPSAMDVKRRVVDQLPKPEPGDGQVLPVTDLQVAGRHCAASGKVIAFERDARLCPGCGQVYHRAHVPETCTSCEQKLGTRALGVEAT